MAKIRFLAASLASIVATLSTIGALSIHAHAQEAGKLEPLYSASFTPQHLVIEVKSTGCTHPENFTVTTSAAADKSHTVIQVLRHKADLCRAMPKIVSLQLELPKDAQQGEAYQLVNTFIRKP